MTSKASKTEREHSMKISASTLQTVAALKHARNAGTVEEQRRQTRSLIDACAGDTQRLALALEALAIVEKQLDAITKSAGWRESQDGLIEAGHDVTAWIGPRVMRALDVARDFRLLMPRTEEAPAGYVSKIALDCHICGDGMIARTAAHANAFTLRHANCK